MSDSWEFVGRIGSGGFGSVDEVRSTATDGNEPRRFARKSLLKQWAADEEARARFVREVRILDELDHPNVLPVIARNLSDSPPWFVMPYADASLADKLEARPRRSEQWVSDVFVGVLNGMAYAHSAGVIHRDLKPENILMFDDVPRVADFGLGRHLSALSTTLTQSNVGMGTLLYMAPEQFGDAKTVGPAADVYALGKVLWEMLAGRKPVVGRPDLDAIPGAFRSFVERSTMERADDRYASANDALRAFALLVGAGADVVDYAGATIESHIREWERTPANRNHEIVRRIAEAFLARRGDEELYFQALPRLDPLLITQLQERHADAFDTILRAYDGHTEGSLPFEYCDVLANFYRRVFDNTSSIEHRALVLRRLHTLGPSHNRWHVGEVYASVLSKVTIQPLINIAAEVIRESSPSATEWNRTYIRSVQIHPALQQAFLDAAPAAAS